MSAVDVVGRYLGTLPGETRRLGHAQWGLSVEPEEESGWRLDIGVRVADGLVRAQALVTTHHELLDPWLFLHWNRQTRFVRFASARNGDLWIHGDLPVEGLDERAVDRLLGLVVEGAVVGRGYAADVAARAPAS